MLTIYLTIMTPDMLMTLLQHQPTLSLLVIRGVYSSRKSELFPSAKHHLPNPSLISFSTSNLQLALNITQDIDASDIFWDDLVCGGITVPNAYLEHTGGPQKLENVVFLKLELCNLMNNFGFRAGNFCKKKNLKKESWMWLTQILHFGRNLVNILIESLIKSSKYKKSFCIFKWVIPHQMQSCSSQSIWNCREGASFLKNSSTLNAKLSSWQIFPYMRKVSRFFPL